MFGVKTNFQQLNEERNRNIQRQHQQEKNTADIDYIAMMCDVELEDTEESDNE